MANIAKQYACLPMADNILKKSTLEEVRENHPDWKLVKCPQCKSDCFQSYFARMHEKAGGKCLCTKCILERIRKGEKL